MIQNIVFDMGKVLISFDAEHYLRRFVPDPADHEIVRRELFRSVEWVRLDRGTITDEAAARAVCTRLPERLRPCVRTILENWHQDIPPLDGMYELARELKQEGGYSLYLLSNTSEKFHDFRKNIPALEFFDGEFISADWHLLKPEPEIYSAFLAHFRLNPRECVFIDDFPPNIEAALNAGMSGVVYHGDTEALRRGLRALGVRVNEK